MKVQAEQLEAVLAEAVEIESDEERQEFVARACGGDAELRRRVDEMIANHFRAGGFLESPVPNLFADGVEVGDASVAERPGSVIGPYKLLEQIGEGGFGVVFMAEQQRPVRRKVALKIVKPGMDTRQVVARFEAERQALAIMDHPNIARVFDGGSTERSPLAPREESGLGNAAVCEGRSPLAEREGYGGRPYFVMELVRGVPITDFCDDNRLSVRQRLDLFVTVCEAVQHAHQKGVIHRDIKPSNVMVTMHDAKPVVKVIDFGIAKATGQPLTEKTLFTNFAQMIGTPMYMSPEQAQMSGPDIDTRTDIYSLGVLLYELLTGTTPFDKERLRSATFDEMRRIIREEEPPKPSTRLTELGSRHTPFAVADGTRSVPATTTLASITAKRRSEPRRLSQLLRGDLDWIVMKALEKDRNRRYESASAVAADVSRHLRDERVLACPPTFGYSTAKFLRRNRVPVVTAAVVLLALVGGIIGTTAGLLRSRHHARLAVTAHAEEFEARKRESARAEAEAKERRRAEAAEVDAKRQEKEAQDQLELSNAVIAFLLHDLLGQAQSTAQADRKFEPDPKLTIREALDRAAATVGDRFKDRPELEASIRITVGDAYRSLWQFDKAIPQLQQAADIRAQQFGRDHVNTLRALYSLAQTYREARMTSAAIELLEQVRDGQLQQLSLEHFHTLTTLGTLAAAYQDAGRTTEALALLEQVRDARIKTLGPNDPATLFTQHNIATMCLNAGKTTEAIAQLEQVRDARIKVLGPEHPDTLATLNNLATAYWQAKQLDKSIPLFEQLLRSHQKILGETHPMTIGGMANLGVNYRDSGRLAEAITLLEQAHRDGRTHESLHWVGGELVIAYARAGKSAEAVPLVKERLAAARKTLPAGSSQLAGMLAQTGSTLLGLKAWADAEPILRECLSIRENTEPDEWQTFSTQSLLGVAIMGQGKYADAEPLLVQGYAGMRERESKMPRVRLIQPLERLVQLYDAWGKPDVAAEWRAKLEAVKAK